MVRRVVECDSVRHRQRYSADSPLGVQARLVQTEVGQRSWQATGSTLMEGVILVTQWAWVDSNYRPHAYQATPRERDS